MKKVKNNFTNRLSSYFAAKKAILTDKNSSNKDKAIARIQLIDVFHKSNSSMKSDKK
jgi:hypothetical protein